MKKIKDSGLWLLIVPLLLLLSLSASVCSKAGGWRMERQLRLGQKYLDEENVEELKAKNPAAYTAWGFPLPYAPGPPGLKNEWDAR